VTRALRVLHVMLASTQTQVRRAARPVPLEQLISTQTQALHAKPVRLETTLQLVLHHACHVRAARWITTPMPLLRALHAVSVSTRLRVRHSARHAGVVVPTLIPTQALRVLRVMLASTQT
jgi:hypothetical protein